MKRIVILLILLISASVFADEIEIAPGDRTIAPGSVGASSLTLSDDFDWTGKHTFTDQVSFGSDATTANTTEAFSFRHTTTGDIAGAGDVYDNAPFEGYLQWSPAADDTDMIGYYFKFEIPAANTKRIGKYFQTGAWGFRVDAKDHSTAHVLSNETLEAMWGGVNIDGGADWDRAMGIEGNAKWNSTGTARAVVGGAFYGEVYSGTISQEVNGAFFGTGVGSSATVPLATAIHIEDNFSDGAATENVALLVEDMTTGGTNYAIKTGLGISHFGDSVELSNLGASFTASDTNPSCGAGTYKIYADLSETKLKKCVNGVVSDL